MTLQQFSAGLLIAHWLIIVGLSIRVIMRRAPIGISLGWLAAIFSVPFVGAVIYLLIGEKRLGRGRAARMSAMAGELKSWKVQLQQGPDATPPQVGSAGESMQRHAERLLGFPALLNNQVVLLDNFQSIFDSLVNDIDNAERTCHVAFYIWHEGGRADDVIEALVRAASRGVSCRVMVDAQGSKAFLGSKLAHRLRKTGVALLAALPRGPINTLFVRADLRDHRKICVIDNRIAYTGSQNLVDPRFFKENAGVGQWVDAMVRITGPAATALDGVFGYDWATETATAFEQPAAFDGHEKGGATLQVIPSGPGLQPDAIHQLLLTAIYAARRELVFTTPYFVPDESILTAIVSAALRGVDVTLIVPAHNDSLLVRYASVAHFDDLLSAGVRIALFQGGLLHTKSLTIDGEVSVFGSVNLDMRSLWLNFEISLFAYGSELTAPLREMQERYLQDSVLLELETWRQRSVFARFTQNAFRLVGPVL